MNSVASLIGTLTGAAIAILLIALLVQFLTKRIAGFLPKYWTVVLALSVHFFVLCLYAGSSSVLKAETTPVAPSLTPSEMFNSFVIDLVVQPIFMILFFRGKEGQKITYWKAFLVNIAKTAIAITCLILLSIWAKSAMV